MNCLVTGGGGQLASSLAMRDGVAEIGVREQDITDPLAGRETFLARRPEILISAADHTAVDRAEAEPEAAMAVNRDGVRHLGEMAVEVVCRFVHISTEFVFDETSSPPLSLDASPNQISECGRIKWQVEIVCRDVLGHHALVVRAAWVCAASHANFVATMLRLTPSRDAIGVAANHIGTLAWPGTLANGVLRLINADARGTHHLTDVRVAIEEIDQRTRLLSRVFCPEPTPTFRQVPASARPSLDRLGLPAGGKALEVATLSTLIMQPNWARPCSCQLRALSNESLDYNFNCHNIDSDGGERAIRQAQDSLGDEKQILRYGWAKPIRKDCNIAISPANGEQTGWSGGRSGVL